MTIPSRPAPPPPNQQQTSSQQNVGGLQNNITIKLPPPPVTGRNSLNFNRNSHKLNNVSSKSANSGISTSQNNNIISKTRYAPVTNWDGSPFMNTGNQQKASSNLSIVAGNKKVPPPRPPPPKITNNTNSSNYDYIGSNTVLKKPGPPQSVNVLSNLFGKKKISTTNVKRSQISSPKLPSLRLTSHHNQLQQQPYLRKSPSNFSADQQNLNENGEMQLISFDSPPSSPTLTQKSNSDCVSVDSFSSDSNFSSPHNGSVSQPESGFEDDFSSPVDPWEKVVSADPFGNISTDTSNSSTRHMFATSGFTPMIGTQTVRNPHAVNKIQPDDILNNGKSLLPPTPALTMPTIIKPKSQNTHNSRYSPIDSLHTKGVTGITLPIKYSKSSENVYTSNCKVTSMFSSPYLEQNIKFPNSANAEGDSLPSPPMPKCPPPPPPVSSLLDVITGKIDAMDLVKEEDITANDPSYGVALYDFDGVEEGDLSFKANEKIYLLQKLNDEWYLGRNKRGCEGMFPINYVEIKIPIKNDSLYETGAVSALSSMKEITNPLENNKVKVLYNFEAEVPEDLALKENDIVEVLYRINDEWLYGKIGNQQGQFPANFIEYIPKDLAKLPSSLHN